MEAQELTGTFDGESTVELLESMRSGDPRAMDRLYRRYLPPLQRWAHGRLPRYARDLMETDDLVQEALLGTLRRLPSFEPRFRGAFHAYLRAGVRNRIRDELRRYVRHPDAVSLSGGVEAQLSGDAPSPLEEAIGRELVVRYEQALETLSDGDREAIIARIELGLPYADVALALDKPSPDAARMAVCRAVARLTGAMDALATPDPGSSNGSDAAPSLGGSTS